MSATILNYFVYTGNERDRERFEKFCKKVFEEHEKAPEKDRVIIILGNTMEENTNE